MKFHSPAAVIFLSLACLPAQTPPPSPSPNPTVAVVATLNKDLSAKKLKIGDKITTEVIQDVLVGGKIVIPRESKIVGHVADVASTNKADPHSHLSLVFDFAKLKTGGSLQIRGLIQALAPPLSDPFVDAAMNSSSPYNPGINGHPVTGGLASAGQTNTPTQVTASRPRETAARALQERERALDMARNGQASSPERNGALSATTRGVFGLPGLSLSHSGSISTIISMGNDVQLKSGSQIVVLLDSSSSSTGR